MVIGATMSVIPPLHQRAVIHCFLSPCTEPVPSNSRSCSSSSIVPHPCHISHLLAQVLSSLFIIPPKMPAEGSPFSSIENQNPSLGIIGQANRTLFHQNFVMIFTKTMHSLVMVMGALLSFSPFIHQFTVVHRCLPSGTEPVPSNNRICPSSSIVWESSLISHLLAQVLSSLLIIPPVVTTKGSPFSSIKNLNPSHWISLQTNFSFFHTRPTSQLPVGIFTNN